VTAGCSYSTLSWRCSGGSGAEKRREEKSTAEKGREGMRREGKSRAEKRRE